MTPFFRCAECGDHVKATEYGECAYCGGDVEIIDGELKNFPHFGVSKIDRGGERE